MALLRRYLATTFLQTNQWPQTLHLRHATFAAHNALLAESPANSFDASIRTSPSDASIRTSERESANGAQNSARGELGAGDFSEFLNETAMEVEERPVDPEAKDFEEQQEMFLDGLETMAQEVEETMPRRQAPLPEDLVFTPEPTAAEQPPQRNAPPTQPPRAPVTFPTFIPVSDKSRPAPPTLSLDEALKFIKSNAKAKFDETVEAAIKLGVNPKRGDQMVRGAASLPHGSGKPVRVAVFASGPAAEEAKAAGADVVGAEDLVEQIKQSGGKLDFDRCIATPAMMPILGQVARILGPRGLMPNPKVGTITNDVAEAVRATKRGRVNFRADKYGIVHVGLGKVSFSERAIKDNLGAFAAALLDVKPAGAKGVPGRYAGYLLSLNMSSSMGPGVRVDVKGVGAMAESLRAQQIS